MLITPKHLPNNMATFLLLRLRMTYVDQQSQHHPYWFLCHAHGSGQEGKTHENDMFLFSFEIL